MSIGVAILLVMASSALTSAPAAILKKERMGVTIGLCFVTILVTCMTLGLIIAVPVTVLLVLLSLWVRFVGHATDGAKRALFIMTLVFSALLLAQHLVHLPIRFALNQPAYKIASNVIGIALAITTLELIVLKKKAEKEASNQAAQGTSETVPDTVSETPDG